MGSQIESKNAALVIFNIIAGASSIVALFLVCPNLKWVALPAFILISTIILVFFKKSLLHKSALGTSQYGRLASAIMVVTYLASTTFMLIQNNALGLVASISFIGASATILCWHSLRKNRGLGEMLYTQVGILLGIAFLIDPLGIYMHPDMPGANLDLTPGTIALLAHSARIHGLGFVTISSSLLLFGPYRLFTRYFRIIGVGFIFLTLGLLGENLAFSIGQKPGDAWSFYVGAVVGALGVSLSVGITLTRRKYIRKLQYLIARTTLITDSDFREISSHRPTTNTIPTILIIIGTYLGVGSYWIYYGWPESLRAMGILLGVALIIDGTYRIASKPTSRSWLQNKWRRFIAPRNF